MHIFMATWLYDKSLGRTLTKKDVRKRLLSFHFLREQGVTKAILKQYCDTGRYTPNKKK